MQIKIMYFSRHIIVPMDINWEEFKRLSEHPDFGVKVAWKHALCRDATCNSMTIWNPGADDPPPQPAEHPGEGQRVRRGRARRAT